MIGKIAFYLSLALAVVMAGFIVVIYFIPKPTEMALQRGYYAVLIGAVIALLLGVLSLVKEGFRIQTIEALIFAGVILWFYFQLTPL
ncbi:hypothetical protein [Runella sp.]|uniref:hypothetical protein n=1 Tax=Runella sp. TaxID=1960881 RepID=UPI003D0F21F7